MEVPADDLMKADSKLIRLIITDRTGKIREVEWNVEGSIFVGRSNIATYILTMTGFQDSILP